MAKNRIGSEDIGRRLGRAQLRGSSSGEPPSSGNTLFGFSLVGVFLAGAGALAASDAGAGFRQAIWEDVMGPPAAPAYVSRVAAICDKGWQDYRDNRDQIDCYMTTDVGRLCDPLERRALADKLLAYQVADDRLIGRAAMSFLKGYDRSAAMDIGRAEAKSRDPNLSQDERDAQLDKVTSMAHDFTAPTQNALAEGSANTHGIVAILNDVKNLAEQGYLAASDFPTNPPKIVKEGLAAPHSVAASSCRTR